MTCRELLKRLPKICSPAGVCQSISKRLSSMIMEHDDGVQAGDVDVVSVANSGGDDVDNTKPQELVASRKER
jgi:hypothetical protein